LQSNQSCAEKHLSELTHRVSPRYFVGLSAEAKVFFLLTEHGFAEDFINSLSVEDGDLRLVTLNLLNQLNATVLYLFAGDEVF